ncbi:MAG: tetratricopeptide repeat protein [Chitinophagales bacterium]
MRKIVFALFITMASVLSLVAQPSKVNSAATWLANGELTQARNAIEEATQNEKTMNQTKTWLYRGRIYIAIARDTTGKFLTFDADPLDMAFESFQKALSMPDVKNWKKDIGDELFVTYNLYFSRGANAYNNGDSESAYTNFMKAHEANMLQLDADPEAALDTGVIFNVGLMAERTKRTVEAITYYQKLIDLKYNESYIYTQLSALFEKNGKEDEALKVLELARERFPNDKDVMITELNYYLSRNQLDVLVGKLNAAIELDPGNVELYFVLGTTHGELVKLDSMHAQEHFDAAIEAYSKALQIDPNRYDINLNAGALYYNTAIEINKAMNVLPLEKEAEYQNLLKQRNKLYTDALPYFEAAHRIDPGNVECMLALKEIYVRTDQKDKADEIKKELGQ